jgi:hypothetical protein
MSDIDYNEDMIRRLQENIRDTRALLNKGPNYYSGSGMTREELEEDIRKNEAAVRRYQAEIVEYERGGMKRDSPAPQASAPPDESRSSSSTGCLILLLMAPLPALALLSVFVGRVL